MRLLPLAGLGLLLLSACSMAPEYHKPPPDVPVSWKLEAPWRAAAPRDDMPKGAWWLRYQDPTLNALQDKLLAANPSLEVASARLAQARAQATAATAGLFPTIGTNARVQRLKISANRPLTNYAAPLYETVQNDYTLSFNTNYEVDLFGRVANSVAAARANSEQSEADLRNARLVLTAELASNYVNLRAMDNEIDVVRRSVGLQRRALELITARYDGGAASGLEVAQQQALLDNTLTQIDILARQRAQYEHAIASLTGTPAPQFELAPDVRNMTPPAVPLGVPSDVLERRPDVAAAERAMASANAQIGVARAAFYPSFMIGAGYGVDSRLLGTLFDGPSTLWNLGVSMAQTIFDGGRISANVDFARAGYQATAANYRRVVLIAMQEVQDGISGLAALERASAQAQTAVADSRKVLDMATSRYSGGATTYLDVITAQQAVLNTERQAAQLAGQRMLVSVFLIKALGGDWENAPAVASNEAPGVPVPGGANAGNTGPMTP